MTNDILEQITEDYFRNRGYFTQHNVKYRPKKKGPEYSVHSDVDFVGIHPRYRGKKRVIVASCKSWQSGLPIKKYLLWLKKTPNKKMAGREVWKKFREISDKIWGDALKKEIFKITGQKEFEFYTIVTKYKGDKKDWENYPFFKKNLVGCDFKLMDMKEIVLKLDENLGTTPSHSELSRLMQLIKAGGGKIVYEREN